MLDRGQYRAIHVALFHRPAVRQLSPHALLALLILKTHFGPAGIEQQGPAALAEMLTHATTLAHAEALAALDELERVGHIRREGNVTWLVEQLAWECSMSASNPKHRTSIQRHLRKLPELSIVQAFREHYAAWMEPVAVASKRSTAADGASDTLTDTLSDTHSHSLWESPKQKQKQKQQPSPSPLTAGHTEGDEGMGLPGGGGLEVRAVSHATRVATDSAASAPARLDALDAWLAPSKALLREAGRSTYLSDEAKARTNELRARGVTAERLARAVRAMLADATLDRAGLSYFLASFERWADELREKAVARWDVYMRTGLADTINAPRLNELIERAARELGESSEAIRVELAVVRPWDIARRSPSREWSVAEVMKRLRAA